MPLYLSSDSARRSSGPLQRAAGGRRPSVRRRRADRLACGRSLRLELEGEHDARWEPAHVLLTELGRRADLAPASRELGSALRQAFVRLERARNAAAAHVALGGEADAASIARHEQTVTELLALLRELHLAADQPSATEDVVPRLRREVLRLDAEREIDGVRRQTE